MQTTDLARSRADWWVAKLCEGIDTRSKEWSRIRDRFAGFALVLLMCVSGTISLLTGDGGELIGDFGRMAYAICFGGTLLCGGWIIRDRLRLKAITHENAAARDDLARRGLEYFGTLRAIESQ